MSQNNLILKHLKKGKTLTPLQALRLFDCWALSSRISNLKADGHNIKTEMITNKGKTFARYSLEKWKPYLSYLIWIW